MGSFLGQVTFKAYLPNWQEPGELSSNKIIHYKTSKKWPQASKILELLANGQACIQDFFRVLRCNNS